MEAISTNRTVADLPNILDFSVHCYPYWEDINEGIIDQLPLVSGAKPIVLDVGCGQAALGQAIEERGYSVCGVECEPSAVEKAKKRITRVISADLNDLALVERELAGQQVDYLIFSDVLEHVYDPLGVLRNYSRFLKPGGKALISVPNIANWEARLKLLFGVFGYTDSGVMDRTHIRFFTHRSTATLVEGAGLRVVKRSFTPYIVRAFVPIIKRFFAPGEPKANESDAARSTLMNSPLYRLYQKTVYPIEYGLTWLWPGLFTFRIIVVGEKL